MELGNPNKAKSSAGFAGPDGLLKIMGLEEGVGVKKKTGQRKLVRRDIYEQEELCC